jgi:hypothetical protein
MSFSKCFVLDDAQSMLKKDQSSRKFWVDFIAERMIFGGQI